jgi:hypothetical protein
LACELAMPARTVNLVMFSITITTSMSRMNQPCGELHERIMRCGKGGCTWR